MSSEQNGTSGRDRRNRTRVARSRRRIRTQRDLFASGNARGILEELEVRLAPAVSLLYPTSLANALVTDLTLEAVAGGGGPTLNLYETGTSNVVASATLTGAGDVTVNIARDGGAVAQAAASDTIHVDLASFMTLNSFVTGNGGLFTLDFNGGTEVPLVSDDHFRVEGSGSFTLPYALTMHSTCDVTVDTGAATFGGDVQIKSDREIAVAGSSQLDTGAHNLTLEAKALDDKGLPGVDGLLFSASTKITVGAAGVMLVGNDVTLRAQSTISITSSNINFSSVNVAFAVGLSDALVSISNGTIHAAHNLTAEAQSNVTSTLDTTPDTANDDNAQVDAVIGSAILKSGARVEVTGGDLHADNDVSLAAENTVNANTTADGTTGAQGGAVGVTVVWGDTTAVVSGGTVGGANVTIAATSDRTANTTAKATAGGAASDGNDSDGSKESEKVLKDPNQGKNDKTFNGQTIPGNNKTVDKASTDDGSGTTGGGDIGLAAAVSVGVVVGDTKAQALGGTVTATSTLAITSSAKHTVSTIADGSTTDDDKSASASVGVAVAIGVADADSVGEIGGTANLHAANVNVSGLMPASTFNTQSTSGASKASSVSAAGSLAVNVATVDAKAISSGTVDVHGANVSLTATSAPSSTAAANAKQSGGGSVGVGASVGINVINDTAHAGVEDGAVLSNAGNLTLAATTTDTATTDAENAAEGGTAITPTVAITVANVTTEAAIGTGGTLSLGGGLSATATQTASVAHTKAKGDTLGTSTAAIGASLALTIANDTVTASTARSLTAAGDVSFSALGSASADTEATASAKGAKNKTDDTSGKNVNNKSDDQLKVANKVAADDGGKASNKTATPKANTADSEGGSSGGSVSVAAAIAINVLTTRSEASLADGVSVTSTGGAVSLTSSANTDAAKTSADGSGTDASTVGVGAAVAINSVDITNRATTGTATVQGSGLALAATMKDVGGDQRHHIEATAKSGAGSDKVGVAGSLAINLLTNHTEAVAPTGRT